MNEEESAERFCRELDALLAGRDARSAETDPRLLRVAGRLAGTDFSQDSKIRQSLRERLTASPRRERWGAPAWAAPTRGWAALAAALVILAALLPYRASLKQLFRAPPAKPIETLTVAQPQRRLRAPAGHLFPRDELGLPVLPGRLPSAGSAKPEPVIVALKTREPIVTAKGRVVRGRDASSVVWELEGDTYVLERRRITLNDIFEKPTL